MKSTDPKAARSRTCPVCRMPGAIMPFVKDDSRVSGIVHTGVECQSCGWTREDKRAQHHDLICAGGCGKEIGPKRGVQDQGFAPIVCQRCSTKHLLSNNPRPVKVRFDIQCPGCDKVVAHYDEWEGVVIRTGFRVPPYSCDSIKCQMKAEIEKLPAQYDKSQIEKDILDVLDRLTSQKITHAEAAVAIAKILTDPAKR
jgi:hypothetical protein